MLYAYRYNPTAVEKITYAKNTDYYLSYSSYLYFILSGDGVHEISATRDGWIPSVVFIYNDGSQELKGEGTISVPSNVALIIVEVYGRFESGNQRAIFRINS